MVWCLLSGMQRAFELTACCQVYSTHVGLPSTDLWDETNGSAHEKEASLSHLQQLLAGCRRQAATTGGVLL